MNIYIPIEIKARELESRLLLALEAASRGHEVILGDKSSTISAAAKGKLKPGILHDKSITPNKKKMYDYDNLNLQNFIVTSQDEEAGIIDNDYKFYLKHRFSLEVIRKIGRNYCWGNFDYDPLTSEYKSYKSIFLLTGSPRVDLWKPDFDEYYKSKIQSGKKFKDKYGSYILIPSNFGSILSPKGFWHSIHNQRSLGYFKTKDDELHRYKRASNQIILIIKFVELIRLLCEKYPENQVVIRPHPVESIEKWSIAIGELPENLHIIQKGSVNSWIRNADFVIHNGCTTGIEARVSGQKVIAFTPDEVQTTPNIANKLSMSISSAEEIINTVKNCTTFKYDNDGEAILNHRLANFNNGLAYKQIVHDWETFDSPSLQKKNNLPEYKEQTDPKNGILKRILNKFYKTDTTKPKIKYVNQKIPYLLPEEIQQIKDGLSIHNSNFKKVCIRRIAQKGYLLYRE